MVLYQLHRLAGHVQSRLVHPPGSEEIKHLVLARWGHCVKGICAHLSTVPIVEILRDLGRTPLKTAQEDRALRTRSALFPDTGAHPQACDLEYADTGERNDVVEVARAFICVRKIHRRASLGACKG